MSDTFIVSRSTSNISKSITNLDTSSQQNKIVPIVVNNVPFEQTFRVTVYLPKNQLYVERIGAKTKLDKLLDQICDNKHLNRNKFEFRHPGDMSMVFNGDSTIGEVGLNELKMVLKSESQFNSNFQDIKLNYKSQTSNSVTSSELSRNSKSQLRKSSPYSSSNSLNSLDSTGQNTSLKMVPPVAPARKKRLAPRPPSQIIIPEQEIVSTNLSDVLLKEPLSILPRRNFHVSSQQLHSTDGYQGNHKSKLSINNAINVIEYETDKNNNVKLPTTPEPVEFKRMSIVTRPMSIEPVESKQSVYLNRSRTSSESSEVNDAMKSYTDVTQSRRTPTGNEFN